MGKRATEHRKRVEESQKDTYHWHKRIIKEMCQSELVINKIVNGDLDLALMTNAERVEYYAIKRRAQEALAAQETKPE